MTKILEIKDLTKNYGSVRALDQVGFSLEDKKIYGLLGRNGAGKTTLLNLISSRIYTTAGTIELFGQPGVDNQQALVRICHMPERNLFPPSMRVRDILTAAAGFYPDFDSAYAAQLCGLFRLEPAKRYKTLSRGYESILRIVLGLAARSEITIFDEPVLGLDAAVRDQFYQALVQDYSEHPRTFILSTHLIDESADIFEDVLILKDGRMIVSEPADQLRSSACHIAGRAEVADQFAREHGLTILNREGIGHLASLAIRGQLSDELRAAAAASGLDVAPVSLQKLFIYLTESEERQA
jgi:ABC-2 type transport system ATP-binding protein